MDEMGKKLRNQQIADALSTNEEFLKAFVTATDAATAQKVLMDNGFELSLQEIEEMFQTGVKEINKYQESASEELSQEQLEEVAGGGKLRGLLRGIVSSAAAFGYGALCAVFPPASAAAPYVVGGLAAYTVAGAMKKGW